MRTIPPSLPPMPHIVSSSCRRRHPSSSRQKCLSKLAFKIGLLPTRRRHRGRPDNHRSSSDSRCRVSEAEEEEGEEAEAEAEIVKNVLLGGDRRDFDVGGQRSLRPPLPGRDPRRGLVSRAAREAVAVGQRSENTFYVGNPTSRCFSGCAYKDYPITQSVTR